MKDDYLDKVISLAAVTKPVEQPNREDWEKLEKDLKMRLPEDFKGLVSSIGNGDFGEFSLLNPISSSRYTQLSPNNVIRFSKNIASIAKEANLPLFPEREGYLWIGTSGNAMELLVRPRCESGWPYDLVWLELDFYRKHVIRTSISRYLYDLYFGLLPENWAKTASELIWESKEAFFRPRKGQYQAHYAPLN